MQITDTNINITITRPKTQDLILALTRAERWRAEGDLRAAETELRDSIEVLEAELYHVQQLRRAGNAPRIPETLRRTHNGERYNKL